MYLDNLIQSIDATKDLLLEKIKVHGPNFYQRTEARSPDNGLNMYSIGCFNPGLNIQEVFVGIQQTNRNDITGIEKTIAKLSNLQAIGNGEYRYGNNFGIRFNRDGSIVMKHGQAEEITNEEYCNRINIIINWLEDNLMPAQRKVRVAGEANISQEETQRLTQKVNRYVPIERISLEQIKGKEAGIKISKYHGTITSSKIGDEYKIILRISLRDISKESGEIYLEAIVSAKYESYINKNGLWVIRGYQSMPTEKDIEEFRKPISLILNIF